MILIYECAVHCGTLGIETSRYSLRATYYKYLGIGDRVVTYVESLGHVSTYGAREHKTVRVAW
jgi:hypothetical protein